MDGTTGITPVMPVSEGMGGGNAFIWIFGLLILISLIGGGGLMGGNGNANALSADMQRGFDTQNLQAQTRDLMSTSNMNASNIINAVKDGNSSLIREFGTVETALTNLGGNMQSCCCEILRSVDGVNYNGAINTAAINANTTAAMQKILDAISVNRMADMQNQINALQLQNAMSGVLRFPSAWTYAGGVFPPVSGTTTTP